MNRLPIWVVAGMLLATGCGEPPAPELLEISPDRTREGTVITLTGRNLGDSPHQNTVQIHGQRAAQVVSWTPERISVYVPRGNVGPGDVRVTVGNRTSRRRPLTIIPPDPFVDSITPDRGHPGDTVVLAGSNFGEEPGSIAAGGAPVEPARWAAGEVAFVVPASPGDGTIVLKTADGREAPAVTFRILTPRISSLEPPGAPTGATLRIKGRDLGTNAALGRVLFDGKPVEIESWTDRAVVAVVPELPKDGSLIEVRLEYRGLSSHARSFTAPGPPRSGPLSGLGTTSGPFSQVFVGPDGWPVLVHADEGEARSSHWNGYGWVNHPVVSHPLLEREIEGEKVRMAFGYGVRAGRDRAGVLHVAMPFHMEESVFHARVQDGTWALETAVPPPRKPTGLTVDLAVDPQDRPVIAVYTEYFGLSLHRKDGDVWTTEVVHDRGSEDTRSSRVDMAFDPAGRLHLAYFDGREGSLKHAARGQTSWDITVVDRQGVAGAFASLAFDRDGRPVIAYQAKAAGQLRLARHLDGAWKVTELDPGPAAGMDTAIAVDSKGRVHVVHHVADQAGGGVARYVTDVTGTFVTRVLGTQLGESSHPSLAIGPDDRVFIVYGNAIEQKLQLLMIPEPEPPKARPAAPAPPQTPTTASAGGPGANDGEAGEDDDEPAEGDDEPAEGDGSVTGQAGESPDGGDPGTEGEPPGPQDGEGENEEVSGEAAGPAVGDEEDGPGASPPEEGTGSDAGGAVLGPDASAGADPDEVVLEEHQEVIESTVQEGEPPPGAHIEERPY